MSIFRYLPTGPALVVAGLALTAAATVLVMTPRARRAQTVHRILHAALWLYLAGLAAMTLLRGGASGVR